LKKGDTVEAMALNIDAEKQRLSLGLKLHLDDRIGRGVNSESGHRSIARFREANERGVGIGSASRTTAGAEAARPSGGESSPSGTY
jgi:hypothetical protein